MSSCPITIFSHLSVQLSFDTINRRIVFVQRDRGYLTKYMESLIRIVRSVDLLIQIICNTCEQIKQKCTILKSYNCYQLNKKFLKQGPIVVSMKTTDICTYNLIILNLDNHKQIQVKKRKTITYMYDAFSVDPQLYIYMCMLYM